MHLRSLTLKGFKSFPDRTRLDFDPGVSVVVGPNGSGKSNVTDAVLWAMGEQSPLTVRGQSMQDVIFGGGRGVSARNAAEVEIVLDNSDGTISLPLTEISIVRRLDRSGEGEYRLNGARCRLADVIEVLSDTGLGKESHSVISQGRVEAIVMSKARDRRMLIEEAAGLGKHRRRRRRAQLKLQRTEENLNRALDVEREARSRLRPLKRQAEAAELHERIERQILEARLTLACDAARSRKLDLAAAEEAVRAARAQRSEVEARLQAVAERRSVAERALSERSQRHEALSQRVFKAQSAHERIQMRSEQVKASEESVLARIERCERELAELAATAPTASEEGFGERDRLQELEQALEQLEREQEQALARELAQLRLECEQVAARTAELEQRVSEAKLARQEADECSEATRSQLRAAERDAQEARRAAAQVGAELAAANQFLRSHSNPLAKQASQGARKIRALGELLRVREGCELALAAALGGRLEAALATDLADATKLLDGAGADGGSALIAPDAAAEQPRHGGAERGAGVTLAAEASPSGASPSGASPSEAASAPSIQPLSSLVDGPPAVLELASQLLFGMWLVERLEDLPESFEGIAVTRSGRVWSTASGEVRQVAGGGAERVLAKRNERDRLLVETERAAEAEHAAKASVEQCVEAVRSADASRDASDRSLREAEREHSEAREQERQARWVIEQRSKAPHEGPLAVRRAELQGELAAERRQAERVARERAERERRVSALRAQLAADRECVPVSERLSSAIADALDAVSDRMVSLQRELREDREAGEEMAGELRSCAQQEAEIQAALRAQGEAVTSAEVSAQRLRDQAEEAEVELTAVSEQLELQRPTPEDAEPLGEEEREALEGRLQRLGRRKEQIGPVNPLAKEEYSEALAHVEELEARRSDLETALRELRTVIRDTDRQIQETFEETFTAAARNFEELVGDVFPGGSGRLRLVREEPSAKPVLGGQAPEGGEAEQEQAAEEAAEQDGEEQGPGEDLRGRGDRDHSCRQVREAALPALRRREVNDGARLPVRGVPRPPMPLLHP